MRRTFYINYITMQSIRWKQNYPMGSLIWIRAFIPRICSVVDSFAVLGRIRLVSTIVSSIKGQVFRYFMLTFDFPVGDIAFLIEKSSVFRLRRTGGRSALMLILSSWFFTCYDKWQVFDVVRQFWLTSLIRWCNDQTHNYDLWTMMYLIICTHHRLYSSNGSNTNEKQQDLYKATIRARQYNHSRYITTEKYGNRAKDWCLDLMTTTA